MDYSYVHLIEQEQAKIDLLRTKIAECERRIEALRSFLNADEFDTLLANRVYPDRKKPSDATSTPAPQAQLAEPDRAPEVQQTSKAVVEPNQMSGPSQFEEPKRRLSTDAQSILRFVGLEGKTLDEVAEYCTAKQFSHTRGSLRSLMSNHKLKHGFITSRNAGFFQLTERGMAFLEEHYPESESETPSVGAEGASGTSTQAAVARGTESDDLI